MDARERARQIVSDSSDPMSIRRTIRLVDWVVLAVVAAVAVWLMVTLTGCATTRTVAPDGTVTEVTTADAQQVALATNLVREIWTQYQAYQAARPVEPQESQADRLQQIVDLVQLLRQVQTRSQVVAPLPAEVAGT